MSVILVLAVLFGMANALAAGTQSDPLITQKYAEGAYRASLGAHIKDKIDASSQSAKVDAIEQRLGFSFAPGFEKKTAEANGRITLLPGSSFTLSTGSAKITFPSGNVMNLSTGGTIASGSALARDQRYFCGENTTAVITAYTAATGYVDGYYKLELGSSSAVLPPVLSDKFVFYDKYISGMLPGLELKNFLEAIRPEGFSLVFVNDSGVTKASGVVCTGDRLRVMDGGVLIKEYTLILYGDVSGNGQIALLDFLMVQKHLLGVSKLSEHWLLAADVNRDGTVSLVDFLMIQKYLLGTGTIG